MRDPATEISAMVGVPQDRHELTAGDEACQPFEDVVNEVIAKLKAKQDRLFMEDAPKPEPKPSKDLRWWRTKR